ncbi:MAG TPA: ribonuclease H-like domain-containing protein [Terriglobia bacterium]|nr:ribonuclease H-like domain-containing protein [Terriglobia bacterium]
MKLEEKLRELKQSARKTLRENALEQQLEYLRRLEQRPRKLPAQKVPQSIEHYVEGKACSNDRGQYFLAQEALPSGRPYGKFRIDDVASADLRPLELFLPGMVLPPPSSVVYLDTETTGLSGGTGTCAFLIGIGAADGPGFRVRQFFLRDFTEEKAALAALTEALEPYQLLVTFNGKTFDLPLLEARYTLARMQSPFARLPHLDLLHPARRLWKLRLESCNLKNLERELLGIARNGDVPGSEIPQIYFDYLRTGSAAGLQPVFFHNALDIVTLAALTVEAGQAVTKAGDGGDCDSRDLFSLSRILERVGASELALATCQRALDCGLPDAVEPHALWQLASQHKRQRRYEQAAELWVEIIRRRSSYLVEAYEELAIHYEHRRRDARKALEYAEAAVEHLHENSGSPSCLKRLTHRQERLRRKSAPSGSGAPRRARGRANVLPILSG